MSMCSPVQLNTSFAAAVVKIDGVVDALKSQGITVSSGSSVGSLFAKVRQLNKQHAKNPAGYDHAKFFAAMEALWIAQSLDLAIGVPGARESIHRIVGSEMDLSGRDASQGKDALWELDLFRRLKLGGADARFEEPDLVVPLEGGLGDYGVACKKLYQESGFVRALERGCSQLKEAGLRGIVAFNLDEIMDAKTFLRVPTDHAMHAALLNKVQRFISIHLADLEWTVKRGGCDGVMFFISLVYESPDSSPPIKLARVPLVYPSLQAPGETAQHRFAAFRQYIDQVATAQTC